MEYLTLKKNSFKKWLIIFTLLFVFAVFYGFYFLKSSMAPMDGVIHLKNLDEKVSVIRDQYGIPHIKAQSARDAARSLGFVVASERLFQMEMQRRMANGELSEIFGPKTLASDKLFRTLGLRARMSEMLQRKKDLNLIDPQMQWEIEAFYEGVNQFQSTQKLPIEFTLLGIKPRAFSVLDAYAFMGVMSFSFGVATSAEPLMTKLRARLGEELSRELRNDLTPYEMRLQQNQKHQQIKDELLLKTKRVVDADFLRYPVSAILKDLEQGFTLFEGSNAWVLSGKRSTSGHPLLANDPHIAYSNPGVWFEAHVKALDFETYGHFLPLLPFPVLAHNQERGWGLTMSLVDDMDLYREKINPQFKSYEVRGKKYAYKERFEKIAIKGSRPFEMVVIETEHGPLMDDVFSSPEDKSIALKWAFRSLDNDPLFALYKMGRARSMQEFKAAVALGVSPGLNVLYADKKNIAWWMFGEIAQKSVHSSSDFILDGSSGLDEYTGVLSFDQKPYLENPSNGIIVSANARPVGAAEKMENVRGDWQSSDRFQTLSFILNQKNVWSIEELKELQGLNLNLENKQILKELISGVDFQNLWKKEWGKSYLEILNKWDFISDQDSQAAALYYSWCREISKLLLKDLSPEEFETFSRLPNQWNFFKRVVSNPHSPWWKRVDRKTIFTEGLNNAILALRQELGEDSQEWTWGHLHTLEFVHPIGRMKPFDKIFNVGPLKMGGALNEISNLKSSGLSDGFKVKAGPSTRRLIDFARPGVAFGLLPTGNSGHLLSPYYKDQLDLFSKGKYREEWLEEAEILSHKTHELILTP